MKFFTALLFLVGLGCTDQNVLATPGLESKHFSSRVYENPFFDSKKKTVIPFSNGSFIVLSDFVESNSVFVRKLSSNLEVIDAKLFSYASADGTIELNHTWGKFISGISYIRTPSGEVVVALNTIQLDREKPWEVIFLKFDSLGNILQFENGYYYKSLSHPKDKYLGYWGNETKLDIFMDKISGQIFVTKYGKILVTDSTLSIFSNYIDPIDSYVSNVYIGKEKLIVEYGIAKLSYSKSFDFIEDRKLPIRLYPKALWRVSHAYGVSTRYLKSKTLRVFNDLELILPSKDINELSLVKVLDSGATSRKFGVKTLEVFGDETNYEAYQYFNEKVYILLSTKNKEGSVVKYKIASLDKNGRYESCSYPVSKEVPQGKLSFLGFKIFEETFYIFGDINRATGHLIMTDQSCSVSN